MANAGGESGGSGRRRSLDGEMNLVPFIDLLSMCICFLLMTAIWIEVGSIQIHQLFGSQDFDSRRPVELAVSLTSPTQYNVSLSQEGRVIKTMEVVGQNKEELISRFSQFVGQVQGFILSKQAGIEISAKITPSNLVDYAGLVSTLDILKGYGISALAVVPVRD
jgi:biopolymer transport protein TolR